MGDWEKQLEEGTLPSNFPLDEAIFKTMGLPSTSYCEEVLAALRSHGVVTWATLIGIDSESKLLEYLKNDELCCSCIWMYLEAYRSIQTRRGECLIITYC